MVVDGRKAEDDWQLKEVYPPATYELLLARIWFLLQLGGNHTVAMLAIGFLRLFAAKWCVPGDVKAAGDGGSFPVERTKVWIAIHVLVSGSFVQLSRTML
jgi:hypothetical protein